MNGLNNISEKILSDAKLQAEEIIAKANRQAAEIREQSGKKADADIEAARKSAEAKCADVIEKARLAATLEGKRMIANEMKAKTSLCFEKAFQKLLSMPDEQYFALLKRLAQEVLCDGEGGELLLNEHDAALHGKKLCADFDKVTLSNEHPNIKGGLIIRRGKIEYNCTLEAISREAFEQAAPEVSGILFPKGA